MFILGNSWVGTSISTGLYLFPLPFCKNQAERQETMKIKIRYENKYQTFEVENVELERWLNISISEEENQEEYEKRIQDEIEERFNRTEYNKWHKHDHYTGYTKIKNKEGVVEVNTEEAIMTRAADQSIFIRDIDELVERINHEWQYEHYCDYLRNILKPDAVELVIAIVLDGMTVGEYAALVDEDANNVSYRYRKAIDKLKKFFQKHPYNPSSKAVRKHGMYAIDEILENPSIVQRQKIAGMQSKASYYDLILQNKNTGHITQIREIDNTGAKKSIIRSSKFKKTVCKIICFILFTACTYLYQVDGIENASISNFFNYVMECIVPSMLASGLYDSCNMIVNIKTT